MQISSGVPVDNEEDDDIIINSHMLMVSGGAFAYVMVMRGSSKEPISLPDI